MDAATALDGGDPAEASGEGEEVDAGAATTSKRSHLAKGSATVKTPTGTRWVV